MTIQTYGSLGSAKSSPNEPFWGSLGSHNGSTWSYTSHTQSEPRCTPQRRCVYYQEYTCSTILTSVLLPAHVSPIGVLLSHPKVYLRVYTLHTLLSPLGCMISMHGSVLIRRSPKWLPTWARLITEQWLLLWCQK